MQDQVLARPRGKINVTFFRPPDGRQETTECQNVYLDDAEWLFKAQVKVSMEPLTDGSYAVYGDYGARTPDGEPDEAVELSNGRSCEDTLAALVRFIRKLKGEATTLTRLLDLQDYLSRESKVNDIIERVDILVEYAKVDPNQDYITHHDDWHKACAIAMMASDDESDRTYWRHQLNTLNAIKAARMT